MVLLGVDGTCWTYPMVLLGGVLESHVLVKGPHLLLGDARMLVYPRWFTLAAKRVVEMLADNVHLELLVKQLICFYRACNLCICYNLF